jgi:hypothetical protein
MAATHTQGHARSASFRAAGALNADSTGRPVRSGCIVSDAGFRVLVARVHKGVLIGRRINAWGQLTQQQEKLPCRSVRVVSV